jgi:hypothetical protein
VTDKTDVSAVRTWDAMILAPLNVRAWNSVLNDITEKYGRLPRTCFVEWNIIWQQREICISNPFYDDSQSTIWATDEKFAMEDGHNIPINFLIDSYKYGDHANL